MSTIAIRGIEALAAERNADDRVNYMQEQNFGVPAHFKNEADGEFSYLKGLLAEISAKTSVSEIPDMIARLRVLHAEYEADIPNPKRDLHFIDFMPKWTRPEMQAWSIKFAAKSFRVPIRQCQSYSARLNDVRRHSSLLGTGVRSNTFTAVDFRSNCISGEKVASERNCLPERLVPSVLDEVCDEDEQACLDAEKAEDILLATGGEAPADPTGISPVGLGVKVVNGWNCSYRTAQPEKAQPNVFSKKQNAMRATYAKHGIKLKQARSEKPVDERLAAQSSWKANSKKRRTTAS